MTSKWMALLVAMAGALVLAVISTTPPAPVPASAPASVFSATRAMIDVRAIARAPHPTGSSEDRRVRVYLLERLKGMGMEVTTSESSMDDFGVQRFAGWSGSKVTPGLTNIIATLPGRDRTKPALLLMAHHDSVWGSPAAADDSAGVASILETVRALHAAGQPQRDLMVLLTDGEELGTQGAKSFFANDPHRTHVGVIINLDTRGGGGRASMFETSSHNGAMMGLFERSVARPVTTSLSIFVYNRLSNTTDYTIAKKMGIPGFNFAFIGRADQYHSPLATPDVLDQGALQDMGRQTLDLARGLLAVSILPGKAPDRTFFTAFGWFLVSYPAGLGWLVLLLGAAGYVVAAWRRSTLGKIAKGTGLQVAMMLIAILLLYLVNGLSGALGIVNYYDRLAAIPRLQWQALFVCLAIFVAMRRWLSSDIGTITGAAIALFALGVFMQAMAPTAAFLFAVPLMLGGLALALERLAGRSVGLLFTIGAAMLGVGYMLGLGFSLLEAVGPTMPMVAVIPLAISTVLLLPLMPVIEKPRTLPLVTALLAIAIGIALWVRLDPMAPSVAVYSLTR